MRGYERPTITEFNESMEYICAASGTPNVPTVTPIETPPTEWDINCSYCNHNSGSHSEVKISAHNYGKSSGEVLSMTFRVEGFKLDKVIDSSGFTVTNVTEYGFTVTRNNHFNPGENVAFVIQITGDNGSGKVGAVGTTGVDMPCTIYCTSYTCN